MFEDFLYLLRASGLKVSLTEWMSLMEALDKGLHGSSFTGFYYLCRCLLVKSEADFDRFDRVFLEYFRDVPFQQEVSQELMDWLEKRTWPLEGAHSAASNAVSARLAALELIRSGVLQADASEKPKEPPAEHAA